MTVTTNGEEYPEPRRRNETAPTEARAQAFVMFEILNELSRAEAKFPGQSLPWGAGPLSPDRALFGGIESIRDEIRTIVDERLKAGTATWAMVLLEEFCESLAESWPAARAELIQLGAMVLRTILDMDVKERAAGYAWNQHKTFADRRPRLDEPDLTADPARWEVRERLRPDGDMEAVLHPDDDGLPPLPARWQSGIGCWPPIYG